MEIQNHYYLQDDGNLEILQTTFPEPYVRLRRNLVGSMGQHVESEYQLPISSMASF